MKILITGSNGLLGQKLLHRLIEDDNIEIIATSKGRTGSVGVKNIHIFL